MQAKSLVTDGGAVEDEFSRTEVSVPLIKGTFTGNLAVLRAFCMAKGFQGISRTPNPGTMSVCIGVLDCVFIVN